MGIVRVGHQKPIFLPPGARIDTHLLQLFAQGAKPVGRPGFVEILVVHAECRKVPLVNGGVKSCHRAAQKQATDNTRCQDSRLAIWATRCTVRVASGWCPVNPREF